MAEKIYFMIALLSVAWLTMLSTGAVAEEPGETLFKKNCAICHTLEAGKNKIGPSLAGVVGRKAGSVPGFAYSAANKNSGGHLGRTDARYLPHGSAKVHARYENGLCRAQESSGSQGADRIPEGATLIRWARTSVPVWRRANGG